MLLCFTVGAAAEGDYSITGTSAGKVKLGMTIQQARRAMRDCRFKRSSDGEGLALVSIACGKKRVMSLFAGEDRYESPVNWSRTIEFIEVWDSRFKTSDGIHPEMFLRTVERILGKVKEIVITQTEQREFITFAKERRGISFRTYGGVYEFPKVTTTKYEPRSRVFSIQISRD